MPDGIIGSGVVEPVMYGQNAELVQGRMVEKCGRGSDHPFPEQKHQHRSLLSS